MYVSGAVQHVEMSGVFRFSVSWLLCGLAGLRLVAASITGGLGFDHL